METKNAQGQVVNRSFKQRPVIKANKAPNVEIFQDESHLVHLLLRKKENDPVKKEYVNFDSVQSFNLVDYNNMVATNFFVNYDAVEVLHMPDGAKQTDEPQTGPHQVSAEEELAALRELSALREQYAALYGTPAAEGASIGDLKSLIDSKRGQIATDAKDGQGVDTEPTPEQEAEAKKKLEGMTVAQLKDKYTEITGETAGNDWLKADLVTAVYLAALEQARKEN